MSFRTWLAAWKSTGLQQRSQRAQACRTRRRPPGPKLCLEPLEERAVPAFLAPVIYDVGTRPQAIVSADFNNDHVQDLAVANYNDSTVSVLLGNADGTFQEPALTSSTGVGPGSLAVGDFDGDGNLDLATANIFDVSVLLGDGTGAFAAGIGIVLGSNPSSVAVGDFNGDGLLDLGVTSNLYVDDGDPYPYDYYGHTESYANVLLGNGAGGFSAPNTIALDYALHKSALAADLNGDLYDDFVTIKDDRYVVVLLGASTGYLQATTGSFSAGGYPYNVAAGDIDGDGDNDLVTTNWHSQNVSVLLGDGLGNFSGPFKYAVGGYPTSVVLGDFTHDGNLDVATTLYPSNQVSVLAGDGAGAFSTPVLSPTGPNPWTVVADDFNGDGWLDAATINLLNSSVSVLINAPPSVSINDPVAVLEGNTGSRGVTFTLTLSFAYTQPITVHYATAAGSAAAGSDYQALSGTLTFAPGEVSKTISVPVFGDRLPETTETFFVNLSSPTFATIADGQGIGTMLDDEPRISISDVTAAEGRKNQTTLFTFTVTLSTAYDQAVTLSFRTVNGTATTNNSDYIARTGTLTFAAGETTKTITIEVKGDNRRESSETFYLDLFGNSGNSLITKSRGVGTILDDD
jgi:hypothetical protein